MAIELADKLYTSTQVADILGVSLRTLYRYMEDNRIKSMRTASGRHRFTKDQILDFLNAGTQSSYPTQPTVQPQQAASPFTPPFAPSPISSQVPSQSTSNFNEEQEMIVEKPQTQVSQDDFVAPQPPV